MAISKLCAIGTPETVLRWLEFTVDMESLVEMARPRNRGENKEVLYQEGSLSSLIGLKRQLPPSLPITEPALGAEPGLMDTAQLSHEGSFF